MNKKKIVIVLLALLAAAALYKTLAQTPSSDKLSATISSGYQNNLIDRGQVISSENSTYVNSVISTPLGKGFDGTFGLNYSGLNQVNNNHLQLTTGVGRSVKVGGFTQYISLDLAKRIDSTPVLEAYQADLTFRFTELPVPMINSLFTPVVTLSKTWNGNNQGIQLGGNRVDRFTVLSRDFVLDSSAVYGTFENYDFVHVGTDLSTRIYGKVNLHGGIGYLNVLSGPQEGSTTPVRVGLSMKF